jgi:hypothetical protein
VALQLSWQLTTDSTEGIMANVVSLNLDYSVELSSSCWVMRYYQSLVVYQAPL